MTRFPRLASHIAALAIAGAASLSMLTPRVAHAEPTDTQRFSGRPAQIERDFARVGYGQLHLRRSVANRELDPAKPPVLLLHQSPNNSKVYVEFMAELGADRPVLAPDTPGFGNSDLPAQQPDIGFYATAMIELIEASGFTRMDIVGYHTGAATALEIAQRRPELVRKLILVGLPAFNADEQAAFRAMPWPKPRKPDGSHLMDEWARSFQWKGPGQSDEQVLNSFIAKLSAGDTAWWGAHAALHYDTIAALRAVRHPKLFIRPKDDLWESSLRTLDALGDTPRIDVPDYGFGIWEVIPERMARTVRAWLDDGAVVQP